MAEPLATDEMRRRLALAQDRQQGIGPDDSGRVAAINQWLPFSTNRPGSASWVTEGRNPQWAVPEILQGGLLGVAGAADAPRTGSLTPELLTSLLAGSSVTGGLLAPRGALAAGAARPQTEWQIFRQPGTNPHNALEVHIAKNPTRDEVARLASESQHGQVRMVRDAEGNNYAWQAELGTHEGIADAIGLKLPDRLNPDSIKRTFQAKGNRITNPKGQTEGWFREPPLPDETAAVAVPSPVAPVGSPAFLSGRQSEIPMRERVY